MQEILTVDQFREIKRSGKGYIAITDKTLPENRVHSTRCIDVTEKYFTQKVITNRCRNGKYFYLDDYRQALLQFRNMRPCQKCVL